MRKIKFRAINVISNKIEFVDLSGDFDWGRAGIFLKAYQRSLMQFTGLKDKNGVEIYEGDIINKIPYEPNYVVKFGRFIQREQSKHDRPYWCEGWYCQNGIKTMSLLGLKWSLVPNYSIVEKDDRLEILGNIFENPKLIIKEDEL